MPFEQPLAIFTLSFLLSAFPSFLWAAPSEKMDKFYLELTDQVGLQAWQSLQRKQLQLLDTYGYETDLESSRIHYIAEDAEACSFGNEVGEAVYQLEVTDDSEDSVWNARVLHYACGYTRFEEDIQVQGSGEPGLTREAIQVGTRIFAAPKGQKSLDFELRNFAGEPLFRIAEVNLGSSRQFQFFIKDIPIFIILYDREDRSMLVDTQPVLKAEWKFSPFRGRYTYSNNNYGGGMYVTLDEVEKLRFVGANSGRRRSLNEFRRFVTFLGLDPIINAVGNQIDTIDNILLPKSAFSNAGASNQELIQLIERLIERLQAGDNQTVIAELVKILESVQSGQIRDLR